MPRRPSPSRQPRTRHRTTHRFSHENLPPTTPAHAATELELATLFHVALRLRGGAQLGKAVKGRSKDGSKGKKDNGGREPTDEEKRLQDAIRRMEMNDYMKRLTVSKQALLREFLAKEARISRTNKLKIQNHWRKIMRLVKVETLRKEVEVRSQNHERDVDRKDAILQLLDRDLDEAEEQFGIALRSHLLHVDALVDVQDTRLLALEKAFDADLAQLEREFRVERTQLEAQHASETAALVRVMHAVDAQEREREAEARQEHEQLREEIRNKNLEDINVLRITLDSSIEELEQHFETAHLSYLQNTDQRTQDFKFLTAKDQDLSRGIELKIRKIERLQASLAHWRAKIAQSSKEGSERNRALEDERAAVGAHFQRLKARMNRMRDVEKCRLADLAAAARGAKATLDEHLGRCERILQLGELARKLETERERVLPFYGSTLADEKEANELTESVRLAARAEQSHADDGDDGGDGSLLLREFQPHSVWSSSGLAVSEWDALDLFWKRVNKVQLDTLAIQREKARVESENRELQAILQQYLNGVSVNDAVMSGANPLLVVNGRLRLLPHQQLQGRLGGGGSDDSKKPIIDANHMVATNRVSK